MATTYSDIATNQQDSSKFEDRPSGLNVSSPVRISNVLYTLVGTEAADDLINLVKLPKGARVITQLSSCEAENPGTALVIDIGDDDSTADDDRYVDGLTLSAGGAFAFSAGGTVAAAELTPHELAAESWVQAKVKTATSLTASQTIRFVIAWVATG